MDGTVHVLYRRWIEELWSGRLETAADLVAPDFVGHWPGQEVHGPDGVAAIIGETRGMFDDPNFEIVVGPLVDGDLVAARWVGTGTGPEGSTSFVGNDILRVVDEQFVEYWVATVTS
ncbi:nuclear transport factor 2 family protein [Rhodococcus fascians]|nr:nuclear transport factor 2 family protein [Rhodococcus fascians]MBY4114720.1 nuclear transport factor 2 family protein [Rhodococcus fascians]